MATKGRTWDAATDRELLLAIIAQHNVSVDCAGVAKLLSKDGKEFTASAVANRVSRLKKMAKDGAAEDAEGTPKSGRKRGAVADDGGSTTKKRKTPKKGAPSTSSDGDDEETGKAAVKEENGSGDELA